MNPIIDNSIGDNNSMKSLSFHWSAIFKDGTKIEQFNANGTENKFQLVKDKFDELAYFNLKNNTGKMFSVNLISGLIGYNRLEFPYVESKEEKENIRLIHFRRVRAEIGEQDLKEKSRTITYYLGYQYLDKSGKNRKIILQIDENGSFIIGN